MQSPAIRLRLVAQFAWALVCGLALATLLTPAQTRAEDCLLDRNDDGQADTGDDDGGANSADDDARIACGVGAQATAARSTAIGGNSFAPGERATALDSFAQATPF